MKSILIGAFVVSLGLAAAQPADALEIKFEIENTPEWVKELGTADRERLDELARDPEVLEYLREQRKFNFDLTPVPAEPTAAPDVLGGEDESSFDYGGPPRSVELAELLEAFNAEVEQKGSPNVSAEELAVSSDQNLRALGTLASGRGLEASIAAMPLDTLGLLAGCDVPDPNEVNDTLIYSTFNLQYNPDLQSAQLNISTAKWFMCEETPQIYTKRWVISILDGGMVGKAIVGVPGYTYRLYAVGTAIRMVAYYEDGELITRLDDNGMPNNKFRFYGVSGDACINIQLRDQPANQSVTLSEPMDLLFCAGNCNNVNPGVDATM